MTELRCTTCDTVVPGGSAKCPGCGLELTTTAAPAVYVERARWPFWPVILGALFLFFLIAHELDRQDAAKAADQAQAFTADVDAGRLNTPEAFIARCGEPAARHDGRLIYSVGSVNYAVTFADRTLIQMELADRRYANRDPADFYRRAGCR